MTAARIAFWGNIANAHYPVVRALRGHGIDAHLFVNDRDPAAWRPETDDPTLRSENGAPNYPDWIHEGPWLQPIHTLAPWRSPILPILNGFDLIVASGTSPTVTQFAEPPVAFYTTGGDLTVRPFPLAFRERRGNLAHQAGHGALGFWQRRAIRRMSQIWTQPFRPFLEALDRLDVDPERIADTYFPLIVDTELFGPDPKPVPDWATTLVPEADFVVFHPSRLVLDESPLMLRSGQTKGSGVLLDGFASFVASGVAEKPMLLLPDNPASPERDAARQRIAELGIEDSVVWAAPPRPTGFHRTEMVHLYALADVTVNEFGAGWFGWVALESMSCGVPVISRIDEAVVAKLYGADHPWIHAQGAPQLVERLRALANDREQLRQLGAMSRTWIAKHHGVDTAGRRAVASVLAATASLGSPADELPKAA